MDATHILYALTLAKQIGGTEGVVRCAKRLRSKYPKHRKTCNRLVEKPKHLVYDVVNYLYHLEAQALVISQIDNLNDWYISAGPYILEGVELEAETLEDICFAVSENLEPCTISRALKESYNAISNSN